MKLLFVHESEKLKVSDKGNFYTDGSYSEEVWERYSEVFPNVTLLSRKDEKTYLDKDCQKKFQFFDKNKYGYIELPNLNLSVKDFINPNSRKKQREVIYKSVEKADYIIVRLPSAVGKLVVNAAKHYNKPYLLEVVGCPYDSLRFHSWKGKILSGFEYKKMAGIIKHAPYVIYVTEKFLQKRYPTKGKSLACSDVNLYRSEIDVTTKIEKLRTKTKLSIGTLGAVHIPYKGHEYVINALPNIQNPFFDFEYYIIGQGNNERLKNIAKNKKVLDKVHFCGELKHINVMNFLEDLDIYIQPSLTEGLPRSIIEALSKGCLCMGSRVGGNSELIEDKFLFNAKNTTEIIKILSEITREDIIKMISLNIKKSKKYESDILNHKRQEFLIEFRDSKMKGII